MKLWNSGNSNFIMYTQIQQFWSNHKAVLRGCCWHMPIFFTARTFPVFSIFRLCCPKAKQPSAQLVSIRHLALSFVTESVTNIYCKLFCIISFCLIKLPRVAKLLITLQDKTSDMNMRMSSKWLNIPYCYEGGTCSTWI